jgi:hypothetical protein
MPSLVDGEQSSPSAAAVCLGMIRKTLQIV